MAKYITEYVYKKYDTKISIKAVDLSILGKVSLNEILVMDHYPDTLIYVGELRGSLINSDVLSGKINVDNISLSNSNFNLIKYQNDSITNIEIFLNKFKQSETDTLTTESTNKNKSAFEFNSSSIKINNLNFKYADLFKNIKHNISDINLSAKKINISNNNVGLNIKDLNFIADNGFIVEDFSADFNLTDSEIALRELHIKTPNSEINSNIDLCFNSISDLIKNYKNTSVYLTVFNSHFGLKDLSYFTNLKSINNDISISLRVSGTLSDLQIKRLRLFTGENTVITTNGRITNMFSDTDFRYYIKLDKFSTSYNDSYNLLPKKYKNNIPVSLKKLGIINLSGNAILEQGDYKSIFNLLTDVGNVDAEIQLNFQDSIKHANYMGNLKLDNLNLGKLINPKLFKTANANVYIDGQGFTLETLDSYIKGNISDFYFKNYKYSNISIEGDLREKLFKGLLNIDDENLRVSFDGLADARSNIPEYNFNLYIDKANLSATNLFVRDSISFLEGHIKMDIKGNDYDNLIGSLSLLNFTYHNNINLYYFEKLKIKSQKNNEEKLIEIRSTDIIDGYMKGNFKFIDLPKMFKNAIVEKVYKNDEYKKISRDNQYLEFDFELKNKIIDIFLPELNIKYGTSLDGSINSETNHLKMKFESPGFSYQDNIIDSMSFLFDNKNELYSAFLDVKHFNNNTYPIHNLNVIIKERADSIYAVSSFEGGKMMDDKFNINFYQTIENDSNIVLGFMNSDLLFGNNDWKLKLNKHNRIVYNTASEVLNIDSIIVYNNKQSLSVNGFKKKNNHHYNFKLNNIDLANLLSSSTSMQAKGVLNADVMVDINNDIIRPVANVNIDSLSLYNDYIGNVNLKMANSDVHKIYNTSFTVVKNNSKTVDASGNISLLGEPEINMDVKLNKFGLKFVNTFTTDLFYGIAGLVSGDVNVNGPLTDPNLDGFIDIAEGGMGIDYLGVKFNFEGVPHVLVNKNEIHIPKTTIIDAEKGTKGTIVGAIVHNNNYIDWDLDLLINAKKLLLLKTDEEDNPDFYGTVFASGNATLKGSTERLQFDINLRTEKGTVFSIPLSNNKTANQSSFIYFTAPNEYINKELEQKANAKKRGLESNLRSGMKLEFKLKVTPDAEVEIVLDEQVGDVMKGRGNADLLIDIDTKGDFGINGTYTLTNGNYLFTLQNLINKKFKIKPGGTISWNGDPLNATINMDAIYPTKTDVASYLDYNTDQKSHKLLVELYLKLSGGLEQPNLNFDIKIPNADPSIQSQLNFKLNENPDERGRQFIMLITLNSFASANSDIAVIGSAASSTYELLANQIGNMASSISDKFDVNVNYSTTTNVSQIQSTDELEVGLSSQFFNDRVTVNGNVGVPVGSSQSSIVGDVEVLLNLTEDGRYKGKVFVRQNRVTDLFENEGYTQGIGISYYTNFDTFKEFLDNLFKIKSNNEIKERNYKYKSDTL
ncbi:MAG: translocation/assembly module TamB domain-containing protein, partial [Ichthyobacteriaceae bacterium]|nr:translocation/assembly module TamB domain-containing protein [Ichthyobacteriaceae bacterium]